MTSINVSGSAWLTVAYPPTTATQYEQTAAGGYFSSHLFNLTWRGTGLTYANTHVEPTTGTITFVSLSDSSNQPVISFSGSYTIQSADLGLDLLSLGWKMQHDGTTWYGSLGPDTFAFFGTNDTINAGGGSDTIELNGNYEAFSFKDFDPKLTALTMVHDSTGNVIRLDSVENFSFGNKDLSYSTIANSWDPNTLPITSDGTPGADTLYGAAGNDTLQGFSGNDLLDGGRGHDLVVYSSSIYNSTILRIGPPSLERVSVSGPEGQDALYGIERIIFSDASVNLTVQSTSAATPPTTLDRICELYVGFFSRVPAADGLENWIRQFNDGKTIFQIADDFYGIGSGPALREYTGYWDLTNNTELSNTDYVKIVYRNVLGREGKAGGISYWSGQLDSGAETRGSLVCKMLDSADTYEGNPTWGWVADLVDDKVTMSKRVAIDWGLNYASTPQGAIAKGMAIAGAVDQVGTTPGFPDIPIKVFDFAEATAIVGVNPASIDL